MQLIFSRRFDDSVGGASLRSTERVKCISAN